MVPLNYYLVLSAILFAIGTSGVFLRRNLITVLLSVEIALNAVNLTFVAVGWYLGTVDGQIIVFFVMTVAAASSCRPGARHRLLPPSRDAQPRRVYGPEVADMLLLIPLLPFFGFLVNALFGRRLTKSISGGVACLAIIASFVVSLAAVLGMHPAAGSTRSARSCSRGCRRATCRSRSSSIWIRCPRSRSSS
jgi:NADH-quinone oxidoreductase subunit K